MNPTDPKAAAELLGWRFEVRERSPGVFEVTATHPDGGRLESIGADPDQILSNVAARALAGQPGN